MRRRVSHLRRSGQQSTVTVTPTLTLNQPVTGAVSTEPATITLRATPVSPVSDVSKVDFYRASKLVRTISQFNVASAVRGATVVASSENVTVQGYRQAATGAIDGDRIAVNWVRGEGWVSAYGVNPPHWMEVTFDGSYPIYEIDVFSSQNAYDNPTAVALTTTGQYTNTDFLVQYWSGTSWLTIPNGTLTNNNLVWNKFTFTPITTNKIRVYITRTPDTVGRIAEIEAWTTQAFSPQTIALNVAAAGTSVGSSSSLVTNKLGYDNTGPINGSPLSGFWQDNTPSVWGDWYRVDFAQAETIYQIDVIGVDDSFNAVEPTLSTTGTLYVLTSYQVQYWNGTTFVDIAVVTGNNKVWKQFTFTPVSTTAIRVLVNGAADAYGRIAELRAYANHLTSFSYITADTWVPAGSVPYSAIATTSDGQTVTSSIATVTVNAVSLPPPAPPPTLPPPAVPPPPPPPPALTESPDGTHATTVIDSSGATWTLGAATTGGFKTLKDGVWTGNGAGTGYVYYQHNVYALNSSDSYYYRWDGTLWVRETTTDPSVAPPPPPPPPVFPPPPAGTPQRVQLSLSANKAGQEGRTYDGPTYYYANFNLRAAWANAGGDYLDRSGTTQGTNHYVTFAATIDTAATIPTSAGMVELIEKLRADNTGMYINAAIGRSNIQMRNELDDPPVLTVVTDTGTFTPTLLLQVGMPLVGFPGDPQLGIQGSTRSDNPMIWKWDLGTVTGTVQSATLYYHAGWVAISPITCTIDYVDTPALYPTPQTQVAAGSSIPPGSGTSRGYEAGLRGSLSEAQLAARSSTIQYIRMNPASLRAGFPGFTGLGDDGVSRFSTDSNIWTFKTWPEFGVEAVYTESVNYNVNGGPYMSHGAWGTAHWTAEPARSFPNGLDECFLNYTVMFNHDFMDGAITGIKLPGFQSYTGASVSPDDGMWFQLKSEMGLCTAQNPDIFGLFTHFYDTDWPHWLRGHAYGGGDGSPAYKAHILTGQKYTIEHQLRTNDVIGGVDQRNAIVRTWVNGVLVYEDTTRSIRGTTDHKIMCAIMGIFHGGEPVPIFKISQENGPIVLSTEYVGPIQRFGTATLPPPPPPVINPPPPPPPPVILPPPPPPQPPGTSPDGTHATTIVDSGGNSWTLGSSGGGGQATLKNGVHVGGGFGILYLWYNSNVYVQNSQGQWYLWSGTSWVLYGFNDPSQATAPPPPPPPPVILPPPPPPPPVVLPPPSPPTAGDPAWRRAITTIDTPTALSGSGMVDIGLYSGLVGFCGMSLQDDANNAAMWSVAAGGHANGSQNGVFKLDLLQDAPRWTTARANTYSGLPGGDPRDGPQYPDPLHGPGKASVTPLGDPIGAHSYGTDFFINKRGWAVRVRNPNTQPLGCPQTAYTFEVATGDYKRRPGTIGTFAGYPSDGSEVPLPSIFPNGDCREAGVPLITVGFLGSNAVACGFCKDPITEDIWTWNNQAIAYIKESTMEQVTIYPDNFTWKSYNQSQPVLDRTKSTGGIIGSFHVFNAPSPNLFFWYDIANGTHSACEVLGDSLAGLDGYMATTHDRINNIYWHAGTPSDNPNILMIFKITTTNWPNSLTATRMFTTNPLPCSEGPNNRMIWSQRLRGVAYYPGHIFPAYFWATS